MKVLSLSVSLLILLVSCVSNHAVELNDLAHSNLNSSVKRVVLDKYSVVKRNKHMLSSTERLYNEQGYTVKTESKWNLFERTLDKTSPIKIYLSKAVSFDKLGKPTEMERYSIKSTDTTYLGVRQMKNDKEIDFNNKGEIGSETVYSFETNGTINSVETKFINKNRNDSPLKLGKFQEIQTQSYFWKDRFYYVIVETNKSIPDTTIYRMDGKLNVISFGEIKNGKEDTLETYSYSYDEEGNWIEKVGMKAGKVNSIEQRQIEYFSL